MFWKVVFENGSFVIVNSMDGSADTMRVLIESDERFFKSPVRMVIPVEIDINGVVIE